MAILEASTNPTEAAGFDAFYAPMGHNMTVLTSQSTLGTNGPTSPSRILLAYL
jgi:hypothetical protein